VLAYSTISQLGYMFLAVGSGAYVAAIFHMVTHAFFKALLFLGAGSVIHGLHDEQDMKRMGALRKFMPITAATFIVGWLAIAGIPPFAGFWSKDDILTAAWGKSPVLWAVGAVTALLTAYYMTRQVVLVFFGDERFNEHADEGHAVHPHESPWTMAVPLVVLAALAVVGGAINLPFTKHTALLERWLDPVVGRFAVEPHASKLLLGAAALLAAALGLALGLNLWRRINRPELEPVVLKRAWGIDALYAAIIETPGRALAAFSAFVIDTRVVDGAVNGVATLVRNGGGQLRRLQTGYVRNYALAISAGGALLLGWMLFRVAGG
jgi:NADH-quinone oxidoreductase subunit L